LNKPIPEMKNISFATVLFGALAIFGIFSCGANNDDNEIVINPRGPTVSFQDGAGIISRDTFVIPGVPFTIRLFVSKGKSPLKSLTITEAGINVPMEKIIHINGLNYQDNPRVITDADVDGFTWDIMLRSHTYKAEVPYHFIVTDEDNETATATLLINTAGQDGTPPDLFIHNLGPNSLVFAPDDQVFNFKVSATKGSSKLAAMAVFVINSDSDPEDFLLSSSYLSYNSVPFTDNPQPLDPADVDGFTNESFGFRAMGYVHLQFLLIDEAGRTTFRALTVLSDSNVPLQEYSGILLYNASGSNLSGLDLDTGQSVSSDSIDADLVDMGNDNIPNGNWLQQLKPADGVVLREVEEGGWLVFSEVSTNNDIYVAFNQGVEKPHTDVLSVGAMFCLYKDNAWGNDYYYLLEIANIVVTPDNDLDYYEINVKRASF
jgi:hypothetical protein